MSENLRCPHGEKRNAGGSHSAAAPLPDYAALHPGYGATLLGIEDLRVEFRTRGAGVRAVDGASLDIPAGEMVGLVGESGCGKTTLARAITGVLPPQARQTGGRITFDGRDLTKLSPAARRDLAWREIAFIPQSAMNSLDPVYRVGRQIREVLADRGGITGRAAGERVTTLFEMVGLDPRRAGDYPHQFSGGMRQRAAIALALALDPRLVIADEPVTALDVIVQRQVLDTFRALQARRRITVILVTHDIGVVAYACDRVVVMYAGEVVESGTVRAVLEAPAHPYTMGLFNAFPDLAGDKGALVPIAGAPPDLTTPPPGCRFAPRCPFATAACTRERPPLRPVEPGHLAACWRLDEVAALRAAARDPATWRRSSTFAA